MKTSHIIGIVVIAVAIAAIIMSVGDASEYVTFSEAKENPGVEYHVVGKLAEGKPISYDPQVDPNFFTFHLKDNDGEVVKVKYFDAKPQDFERSEQVVIIGKIEGDEFEASKILMKCPSKYQEEEIKVKQASTK